MQFCISNAKLQAKKAKGTLVPKATYVTEESEDRSQESELRITTTNHREHRNSEIQAISCIIVRNS